VADVAVTGQPSSTVATGRFLLGPYPAALVRLEALVAKQVPAHCTRILGLARATVCESESV